MESSTPFDTVGAAERPDPGASIAEERAWSYSSADSAAWDRDGYVAGGPEGDLVFAEDGTLL